MDRRRQNLPLFASNLVKLEDRIMSVWSTKEDIDTVMWAVMDKPLPLSEDELANLLIGLAALHESRCQQLYDMYTNLLKEQNEL
jgi:hypothetical protein